MDRKRLHPQHRTVLTCPSGLRGAHSPRGPSLYSRRENRQSRGKLHWTHFGCCSRSAPEAGCTYYTRQRLLQCTVEAARMVGQLGGKGGVCIHLASTSWQKCSSTGNTGHSNRSVPEAKLTARIQEMHLFQKTDTQGTTANAAWPRTCRTRMKGRLTEAPSRSRKGRNYSTVHTTAAELDSSKFQPHLGVSCPRIRKSFVIRASCPMNIDVPGRTRR